MDESMVSHWIFHVLDAFITLFNLLSTFPGLTRDSLRRQPQAYAVFNMEASHEFT